MKSAMRELENVKKDGDNKDDSPATTPEKKFVNTGLESPRRYCFIN